jgi:hypothetical protein
MCRVPGLSEMWVTVVRTLPGHIMVIRTLGQKCRREGPWETIIGCHSLPVGIVVALHPSHCLIIMLPVSRIHRMTIPGRGSFRCRCLQNKGKCRADTKQFILKRNLQMFDKLTNRYLLRIY